MRQTESDGKHARAHGVRVSHLCHSHGGVDIDLDDGDVGLVICGEDATEIGLASGYGDMQKRFIARFARGDRRAVCDDVRVGDDVALLPDEEARATADLHGLRVVGDEGREILAGGDATGTEDRGDDFLDGVGDGVAREGRRRARRGGDGGRRVRGVL